MNNSKFFLSKASFFGAALGTMVEYFDIILFSTFLPLIAPVFFPAETAQASLVKGYFLALFSLVARPLGALMFGYIGDIFGRRKALLGSMYGIALATIVIGLTPSFASIGIAAVVCISLAKIVQLFCFGGEFNSAGIYAVEHAKPEMEGLVGGLLTSISLTGSLIAAFLGFILTGSSMPSWSWRLAFIIGGIIGLLSIVYRQKLLETPQFTEIEKVDTGFKQLLQLYPRELLVTVFAGGLSTVPFTSIYLFINPLLMNNGLFTSHAMMFIQCIYLFFGIVVLLMTSLLTRYIACAKLMQVGSCLFILFAYPILALIDQGKLSFILLAFILLITFNEIFLAPAHAYLKNLFPVQYRCRGSAIAFSVGMSVFGGLTPLVENFLYTSTGRFSSLFVWLGFISLCTSLSMWWVKVPTTPTTELASVSY